MIQIEWFVYGAVAGFVALHAWPFICLCLQEWRTARENWHKKS